MTSKKSTAFGRVLYDHSILYNHQLDSKGTAAV